MLRNLQKLFENKKEFYTVIGIFISAFIVRIIYLLQISASPIYDSPLLDALLYDRWAMSIVKDGLIGKQLFYGMPLYSYLLALIYKIFGHNFSVAYIFQILIGSINCVFVYLIANKLFNRFIGITASVICVFYSMFILYEGVLIAVPISILLGLLTVYLLLLAIDDPSNKAFLKVGICLGLFVLAKAAALLFVVFILVWMFLSYRTEKNVYKYIGHLLVPILLLIGLITLKNYIVAKDFIPLSAHGGINYYIGNNPQANGMYKPIGYGKGSVFGILQYAKDTAEEEMGRSLKPSQVSGFWYAKAFKFIVEHPSRYIKLLWRKFVIFWNAHEVADVTDKFMVRIFSPLMRMPLITFGFLCPIALLGLLLSWKTWDKQIFLYIFILSNMIAVITFFVNSRYRIPIVPFLSMFAGYTIWWWYDKFINKEYEKLIVSVFPLLIFCFMVNNRIGHHYIPVSYLNLGNAYMNKQQMDKAAKFYKKALEIDSAYADAHYKLGNSYAIMGQYDKAIKSYIKAIELAPDYVAVYYDIAVTYARMGLKDKSRQAYEKVLDLDAKYPEIKYAQIAYYVREGQDDKAIKEMNDYLLFNKKDGSLYYNLGNMYLRQHDFKDAIKNYEKALELKPDYLDALNNIGNCYAEQKIYDQAKKYWQRAVDINPNFKNLKKNIKALEKMGF